MRTLVFVVGWTLGAALAQTPVHPLAVQLRGSPTLMPMAQGVAERYMREHPETTIVVSGGGTYRGYKSVLDGTADVALVSSEPQDDVRQLQGPNSPTLVKTTVGYTAVVPVVHGKNPLNNLSVAQLRDVFAGRVTDWKMLGGQAGPVHIYVGFPSEGLTETWRQHVMGSDANFTPKGKVQDVATRRNAVASDPGGIAFVSHGDLREGVRQLAVDGVTATVETVQNSRYPLGFPLMLVTRESPTPAVQAFVRYFSAPDKRLRFAGVITAETRE
ncbi:MAG: phosphate ABC transporter substrate-binding protein [Burkholderiales bacterium]|nr:phosphate ABC transporter substrate-binding protein [Burkholderiales bacterium]